MAKRFGVMLDCSRNAVMKPEKVKEYADLLKKMGYNMLMMYTEDTYEIPDEPYFGYLRGRYSIEDLRSISEYCHSIGIEVVPAIQTLAHIDTIFRWGRFHPLRDSGPVLLAEDERTYALIRSMFAACREAYPYTNVINIGMDEAYGLGLGSYLHKHGYVPAHEILLRHLARVIEIAKEFDFEPIMWSDMFFRLEHDGLYEVLNTPEEVKLSDEVVALCPKGVSQVFWRYHSPDEEGYRNMIREHKRFGGDSWFAGGAFTWDSMMVSNTITMNAMLPAMDACAKEGVENIFITMWGNDGKNCSYFSMMPSLYAVRRHYDGITDMEQIKKEFEEIFGERFDDMMLLDVPGYYGNTRMHEHTYHMYNFYNDPFLGFLDDLVQPNAKENYSTNAPLLQALADKGGRFAYLYQNAADFCRVMEIKYDLGLRTRKAYQAQDKEALAALVADYRATGDAIDVFTNSFRKIWYYENRPHGFEVQEHRLGGLAYHIRSLGKRLLQYVQGEIAEIPELAEEILPYWNYTRAVPYKHGELMPGIQGWRNMISVNRA